MISSPNAITIHFKWINIFIHANSTMLACFALNKFWSTALCNYLEENLFLFRVTKNFFLFVSQTVISQAVPLNPTPQSQYGSLTLFVLKSHFPLTQGFGSQSFKWFSKRTLISFKGPLKSNKIKSIANFRKTKPDISHFDPWWPVPRQLHSLKSQSWASQVAPFLH